MKKLITMLRVFCAALFVTVGLVVLYAVFVEPPRTVDTTLWPESASALWLIKDQSGVQQGMLVGTVHCGFGALEYEKLKEFFTPYVMQAEKIYLEVESYVLEGNAPGVEKALIESARRKPAYSASLFSDLEKAAFQHAFLKYPKWGMRCVKLPWNTLERLQANPDLFKAINSVVSILWNIPHNIIYSLISAFGFDNGAQQAYAKLCQVYSAEAYQNYMKGQWVPQLWYRLALKDNAESVIFLSERNHAWMTRITDSLTAHESPIIAVGAAHLFGRDGLINLLQEAGWVVEPLQVNPFM